VPASLLHHSRLVDSLLVTGVTVTADVPRYVSLGSATPQYVILSPGTPQYVILSPDAIGTKNLP